MAKEKFDLRTELRQLRFEMNFLQRIDCSKEENKKYAKIIKEGGTLPDGVVQYKDSISGELLNEFYIVYDAGLTNEEEQEYIQYQILLHIKTIKNCVVFFTVLTVISLLIVTVISLLQ